MLNEVLRAIMAVFLAVVTAWLFAGGLLAAYLAGRYLDAVPAAPAARIGEVCPLPGPTPADEPPLVFQRQGGGR